MGRQFHVRASGGHRRKPADAGCSAAAVYGASKDDGPVSPANGRPYGRTGCAAGGCHPHRPAQIPLPRSTADLPTAGPACSSRRGAATHRCALPSADSPSHQSGGPGTAGSHGPVPSVPSLRPLRCCTCGDWCGGRGLTFSHGGHVKVTRRSWPASITTQLGHWPPVHAHS